MIQVWTDVTASRKLYTSYQNTTGASIVVNVAIAGDGSVALRVANTDNFHTDDIAVGIAGGFPGSTMSVTVPASSWYLVRGIAGGCSIISWAELR